MLGGDVGGLEGAGPQSVDGGDVDHPAPLLLVHVRESAAQDAERRLDHDALDEGEAVGRELVDGRDVLEAGVVDHDVGVGRQGLHGLRVGEVRDDGVAADPLGQLPGRAGREVDDVDPGAGPGEGLGAGPADARGGPGDQGRPAVDRAGCSGVHGRER